MVALDFPASPTVGQIYMAAGARYVWNGYAWNLQPSNANLLALIPTSDLPPASPQPGQAWWKSSTGILYIWYDDGNTAQWVEASGGAVVGSPASAPNALYSTVVANDSLQSIPNNVITKITNLGLVDHDPSGYWDTGVQEFQPQKPGLYLISGKATLAHLNAGVRAVVWVFKNNVMYAMLGRGISGDPTDTWPVGFGGSIGVPMNGTTDVLDMRVLHASTAAVDLLGTTSDTRYTSFTAIYEGDA